MALTSNGFTGPASEDFVEESNGAEFKDSFIEKPISLKGVDATPGGGDEAKSYDAVESSAESNAFVSGEAGDIEVELNHQVSSSLPPDASMVSADGFELVQDPTGAPSQSTSQVEINAPTPTANGSAAPPQGDGIEGVPRVAVQRTFYFVRTPRPDISDIVSEISREAEKLESKRRASDLLKTAVTLKQTKRRELWDLRKDHRTKALAINAEVQKKYDELRPMQTRVNEIRDAGSDARSSGRSVNVNSIGELQQRIADIEHRMQHEVISLQEEKKLLRELQALEKSRPEVQALEARKSTVDDQKAHKDGLQTQLKPLYAEIEALKLQRDGQYKIADSYTAEVEAVDAELENLNKDKQTSLAAQDQAYNHLRELRRERGIKESDFWQYRGELEEYQKLIAAKDFAALEKFFSEQVERFHVKWKDPAFRASYIKANERSTLRRFQTFDTRRPGVDEDPAELINAYNLKAEQASASKEKANSLAAVQNREVKPSKPAEAVKETEVKEAKTASAKASESAAPAAKEKQIDSVTNADVAVKPEVPVAATQETRKGAKESEEELAVLKEKRREEAMAKAKEAEERKKRLAEKGQARAAVRAAKEAEEAAKRREKERQRKERKKVAASSNQEADGLSAPSDEPGEEASQEPAVEETQPIKDEGLGSRQRKRGQVQKKKARRSAEAADAQHFAKESGKWPMQLIYISGAVFLALILAIMLFVFYSPWATASS